MSPPLPTAIGRYEVRERIGQGGMGALFLALDPAIDRLVALKLLRVDSDEMRARFLREARSAGRLHHPNIVTVYDVGEHEGQPFIAMEYVKGETLGDAIKRRAPLSLSARIQLMENLCEGLQYAHDAGLIHRDIKPANLMVPPGGEGLKILDFGIARGAGDAGLTEVGMTMGTPNYMSPEQASGKTVDSRSDIFAVGAVVYETFLYRQAYPGKDWTVVLPRIIQGAPDPPSQIDPTLNPAMDAIIARAMARDPDSRYQDLRALSNDLRRVREELGTAEAEAATTLTPTATPVGPPRATPSGTTPRPVTDRARLDSLRKEKVRRHVQHAEQALAGGDVDRALAEVEEASLLDVDDTRVIMLLQDVGVARDAKQVETHVAEARGRLAEGALTDALSLVDHALELHPEEAVALELRERVVTAFEERDRQRDRARMIDGIIQEARQALDADAPDKAVRGASEALAYEPGHPEALALKQHALTAVEERRRREASERTARQAIERAREEFAADDHSAAFARLERLAPIHRTVAHALSELRAEAAAIERNLESGEAAQERMASWVAGQIAAVRRAVTEQQWKEALAQVSELRARAPRTPELPELTAEVERGRVEATRLADVAEYLSEARRQKAAEDFPAALSRVDAALAVCPDHAEANALRHEIEEFVASTEQRREAEAAARRKAEQEAATAWLSEADSALRAGRFDAALKALEEVNEAVVTATQAVRLRDLAADAESRREKARAEKAALRQQRIVEVRTQVGGLLGRGGSAAQAAARNRRIQIGGAVIVVLAAVGWVVMPSSSPGEQGGAAASGVNSSTLAARVPPGDVGERRPTDTRSSDPASPTLGSTEPSRAVAAVDSLAEPTAAAASAPGASDAEAAEAEAAAVPDPLDDALGEVANLAEAGQYREAFERLQMLDGQVPRVDRARGTLELSWNAAGVQTADRARAQADAGDFGAALTLINRFEPENEFVESAREEVEREWAAEAETLSRRALEMAAGGDHDGAVALLEASVPPHPAVIAALTELVDSPDCGEELPSVRAALVGLTLSPGVASPSFAACEGAYRFEIQNEVVRFGAGCERASASAFVPLLCEGSAEWTSPGVVRFVLRRTDGSWSIAEVAEMGAGDAPP